MSTPRAYQRVNTATDYATSSISGVPFPVFLKFDGVDDSLSTNSISFTSTDKMSVFAGVRKLVDPGATGILCELSANGPGNNGTFTFNAPQTNGQNYGVNVQGTTANNGRTYSTYAAPITNVLSASLSTVATSSAEAVQMRINNALVAGVNSIQGTGTGAFGNYPLFIGRRNNASLPFNGQMYSMIIVGKAVTAGELSSTEKFVASKTGVTL